MQKNIKIFHIKKIYQNIYGNNCLSINDLFLNENSHSPNNYENFPKKIRNNIFGVIKNDISNSFDVILKRDISYVFIKVNRRQEIVDHSNNLTHNGEWYGEDPENKNQENVLGDLFQLWAGNGNKIIDNSGGIQQIEIVGNIIRVTPQQKYYRSGIHLSYVKTNIMLTEIPKKFKLSDKWYRPSYNNLSDSNYDLTKYFIYNDDEFTSLDNKDYGHDMSAEQKDKIKKEEARQNFQSLNETNLSLKLIPKDQRLLQNFRFEIKNNYHATIGEYGFSTIIFMSTTTAQLSGLTINVINDYGISYDISLSSMYSILPDTTTSNIQDNYTCINLPKYHFTSYDKITLHFNQGDDNISCNVQNNIMFYNNINTLYNKIPGTKLFDLAKKNIVKWWTKIRISTMKDNEYYTDYITNYYDIYNSNNNLYNLIPYFDFFKPKHLQPNAQIIDISKTYNDIVINTSSNYSYIYQNANNIFLYSNERYQPIQNKYIFDLNSENKNITIDSKSSFNALTLYKKMINTTSYTFFEYNKIKKPTFLMDKLLWKIRYKYIKKDVFYNSTLYNPSSINIIEEDYGSIDNAIKDYIFDLSKNNESSFNSIFNNQSIDLNSGDYNNILKDDITTFDNQLNSSNITDISDTLIDIINVCTTILNDLDMDKYEFQVDVKNPEIPHAVNMNGNDDESKRWHSGIKIRNKITR